jgi:hypothetical protein
VTAKLNLGERGDVRENATVDGEGDGLASDRIAASDGGRDWVAGTSAALWLSPWHGSAYLSLGLGFGCLGVDDLVDGPLNPLGQSPGPFEKLRGDAFKFAVQLRVDLDLGHK